VSRPEAVVDALATTLRLERTPVVPTLPANVNSILRSRVNRLLRLSPDSTAIIPTVSIPRHLQRYGHGDGSFFESEAGEVMKRFDYS